jgi:hypothetical protein
MFPAIVDEEEGRTEVPEHFVGALPLAIEP